MKNNFFSKIGKHKKPIIIFSCIAVICIAVYVDWSFNNGQLQSTNYLYNSEVSDNNTKILGEAAFVNNLSDEDKEVNAGSNYFSVANINRQRTRDEALETLQQVVDSAESMPDAKDKALNDMMTIATDMEKEVNIESLIKAKGFDDCLAVISGNNINVIVKTTGLLANEVAQIKEIVMKEAGIPAQNIKIVEKA